MTVSSRPTRKAPIGASWSSELILTDPYREMIVVSAKRMCLVSKIMIDSITRRVLIFHIISKCFLIFTPIRAGFISMIISAAQLSSGETEERGSEK